MLKPSPAFAQFEAATDATKMQPIFQNRLSRLWGRPVEMENFHIPRVIPKGEGRFLIQYRFSTVDEHGSRERIFFGRILSASEMIPDFAKEPEVFFVSDSRLVVPVFPFDPKLKMLAQFFSVAARSRLLQPLNQAIGLNGTAQVEHVDVLGYRLERRGTLSVRICGPGGTVSLVAKLVRPEKGALLFERLQSLEENGFGVSAEGNIRVPHPVAATPEGVVWQEAVFDSSLHDLVETERLVTGCRSAGLALQKLHKADLKNLPAFTMEEARAQLKALTLETAQIYPVLREAMENTGRQLEGRAPVLKEKEFRPVHRDFYDKQLLVGADRTTLLDTDTLSLGDPAQDVGNFLAHLTLRGIQHSLPEKNIHQARTSFLEAYFSDWRATAAGEFQKRAAWWEAASLLRLACLYSLRPRWKKLATPLLEQTKKNLRGEEYA